ncbi:hypothetical protein BJX66DRAFT_345611 [Aspergillus keveii]|uniref:Rhodopsin domain-containing protein n=1 Tax=Aspergillus keveii TaxID=714993 RepID=A0ABR4FHY3_9EURO
MTLHDKFPAYGGSGSRILGLGIGLGSVATVLVALRVYVRIRITRFGTTALAWSLAAWTITVTAQVFGILATFHGAGNDISIVEATHGLHGFLLYSWLTVFFFSLALPLGKVAVAAFLLEICAQVGPKVRSSLLAIASINIITSIPILFIVWFQCSPVNALWDPRRQGQCDYRVSVYYTYVVGSIAALTDFYLAIIPIIILKPLHITTRRKAGLCFLMGCGVFAGIAAILRTYAARLTLTNNKQTIH